MFSGFSVFGVYISCYSICVVIGLICAAPVVITGYTKRGGDGTSIVLTLLVGMLGAAIGMHLMYGITNISHWNLLLKAKTAADFFRVFLAIFSGSVFYGGLLGGLLSGFIFARKLRLPMDLVCDCTAPAIALFHAFGRVGCFMAGCCFGIESEHGITFSNSQVEIANGVARVPVQLYEAAFELALFIVLAVLHRKDMLRGKLLALYLIAYSAGRFVLEFLRGDDYRGFILGMSTSQFISIIVFIAAGLWFVFRPDNVNKTKGNTE